MQPVVRSFVRAIERESPSILTGLGITGIPTAIFMAIRATPKALSLLEMEKGFRIEREFAEKGTAEDRDFTKLEIIKITWKCYVPTALVALASIACIIGSHSISLRRNAALAGLYTVTEAALKEYQEKVIETIGKNKEEKIRDAIIGDKLDRYPISSKEVILTGKGETLFFDTWSGRYFKSDMETVRKIQNDLNAELFGGGMYISLNSFYDALGLERITSGEEIGWDLDGKFEIKFTSKIAADSVPCIVMEYSIYPKNL